MRGPARRAMKQPEIVARQISQQIVADGLVEGTRLPTEKAMIEEYQVGRSTLREALRLLENRGVLSIRTGRDGGPVVRRPRPADLGETIGLILQFDGISLAEVFAARRALAPRLVRRAVDHVSAGALVAMSECLDRMERYADQASVFDDEVRRFHTILAAAADSPVFAILVSALDAVAENEPDAQGPPLTRTRRVAVTAIHQRLYGALDNGDADAAADAMVEYLDARSPAGRTTARARRPIR